MNHYITFDEKEVTPTIYKELSVFAPPTKVRVVARNAHRTIYIPFTVEKYKEIGVCIGDRVELNGEELWVVSVIGDEE